MTNISGINNQSILDELGLTQKKDQKTNELGQEDFLELMIAQIKNQDPLKPEANGDFMAQMAQFSTADGIASMQKSLDNLSSSLQSNQALQASALVGRNVLVPSDTANLVRGGAVEGIATLPAAGRGVSLDVYNASTGELVKQVPLGDQPAGELHFTWDGTNQANQAVPAGSYKFAVAGSIGQENLQFGTHLLANVDSVTLGTNGEGLKLNVAGVGQINLNEVKQIRE